MGLPNPQIYKTDEDRCEYIDWITEQRCAYEAQMIVHGGQTYCKWHGPEISENVVKALKALADEGLIETGDGT